MLLLEQVKSISLRRIYHENEAIQAAEITSWGWLYRGLTRAFLHSLYDLKTARINVQRSLIEELILLGIGNLKK